MTDDKRRRLSLVPALSASGWSEKLIARVMGVARREIRRLIAREASTRRFALPYGIQNEREFVRLSACDLSGLATAPAVRAGVGNIPMFRVEQKRRKLMGSERIEVLKRDKFRCAYCGVVLAWMARDDYGRNPRRFTIDHVLPIELGGENVIDNCVASCRWCNYVKRMLFILDRSRSPLHSEPSVTIEKHTIRSKSVKHDRFIEELLEHWNMK